MAGERKNDKCKQCPHNPRGIFTKQLYSYILKNLYLLTTGSHPYPLTHRITNICPLTFISHSPEKSGITGTPKVDINKQHNICFLRLNIQLWKKPFYSWCCIWGCWYWVVPVKKNSPVKIVCCKTSHPLHSQEMTKGSYCHRIVQSWMAAVQQIRMG